MTGDAWTRAEKKMKERDRRATSQSELRDEWRRHYLTLADNLTRRAAENRARAAALATDDPDA